MPTSNQPPDSSVPRRPDRDRRVRQSARIARVLSVLNLIQSRGRWNAQAIADELECSVRTVYRDLEVLEFAGVPYFFHLEEDCYRVRPDYYFPVLGLTDDEAVGQVLASTLTRTPGLNINSGAGPTTRKLAASVGDQQQQVIADASRVIDVFNLKLIDHSRHHQIIKTIQFALLTGKQIAGTYESPYAPKPQRLTIHPYRLCLIKQAWYVIGHREGESTPKSVRVARFSTLRLRDQPADIPEDFHLGEYLGDAWGAFRGETSYDVELRFEPEAAKIVTETTWHHTQQVKQHRDGRATLKFTVDGLTEILHWMQRWSGQVTVREPILLRELYCQTLENALLLNFNI